MRKQFSHFTNNMWSDLLKCLGKVSLSTKASALHSFTCLIFMRTSSAILTMYKLTLEESIWLIENRFLWSYLQIFPIIYEYSNWLKECVGENCNLCSLSVDVWCVLTVTARLARWCSLNRCRVLCTLTCSCFLFFYLFVEYNFTLYS